MCAAWKMTVNLSISYKFIKSLLGFTCCSVTVGSTTDMTAEGGVSSTGPLVTTSFTLLPHCLRTWATCSLPIPYKSVSPILRMWSPLRKRPSWGQIKRCSAKRLTQTTTPIGQTYRNVSAITWSAMPPGRIVLTITPVVFPPTIPKPRPVPSFTSSIVSTCCHWDEKKSKMLKL